jgi:hypothetical protein
MTQQDVDTEDGAATAAWRRRLTKWGKPVIVVALVALLIGAAAFPSITVSAAETVWCSGVGCEEPVEVSQTETVVVEESTPVQQTDAPSDPANTTADTETNATIEGGGGSSVEETTADASAEKSSKTVTEEATATPWWWFLLAALPGLFALPLAGLALYRRLGQTDSATESASYPATLQPRVVRGKAHYTDGGTETASGGAASSSEPARVRLTEARAALDDGLTDQSVALAVQALADACEHEEGTKDHAALFDAWESTAAERATLPDTLDQLHGNYEQAIFSSQSVPETDAMAGIETAEVLLTASNT